MHDNLNMIMANPGDRVKVEAKEKVVEGIYMPNSNEKIVFVKLDSGYNVGIERKNIKNIKVIEKYMEKKEKTAKAKINKKLPTISILHTGGTIASKVDYRTGGVVARFSPEELLAMFPELKEIANIKSRLIANMWSDDMRFNHYNKMAREVQKELKEGIEGIIITHGTDTMHYSSAALSFALEGLPVPVILVGAQRSSDRGSSDAGVNLICAADFIAKTDFAGVAVCMHESMEDKNCLILPACKTRKLHTSRRDAFKPVNDKAIAIVNYREKKIDFRKKDYSRRDKKRELKLKLFDEKLKIAILKIHTNMFPEQFSFYKNYDGLVIEGTGLGHTPGDITDDATKVHKKIMDEIKNLAKKMPVVMAPQTIFGRVNMNVYSKGRDLQDAGVIGNLSDMTPETAFIKLAWLLSNYKKDQVKELVTKNLRGEISDRSEVEEEYL